MPTTSSKESVPGLLEDEELLDRYAQDGCQDSFTRLYDKYAKSVRRRLRALMGSYQDVDELVQDTFLLVHERYHQYQHGQSVRNWLLGIATNLGLNKQRNNRALKRGRDVTTSMNNKFYHDQSPYNGSWEINPVLYTDDRQVSPEDEAIQEDLKRKVSGSVNYLSPKQREVVRLVYFEGFTQREAAGLLGVAKTTVVRRLNDAISCLRGLVIPEDCNEEDDGIPTTRNLK